MYLYFKNIIDSNEWLIKHSKMELFIHLTHFKHFFLPKKQHIHVSVISFVLWLFILDHKAGI